jgi:endonuclease-3
MKDVVRPRKVARHARAPGTAMPVRRTVKRPFDIDTMIRRLRKAVKPFTPAAMFQLHDEGFDSVFEILVACIISIRTFDEVTLPTARRLFAVARTPRRMAALSAGRIDELIHSCTFHEPKSKQIHQIAEAATEKHDGTVPCDFQVLTSFRGVGPKCANLVLGVACDDPHGIGVDIHVHRVTNRWGYVRAHSPEATMLALQVTLPRKYWIEINKLLVPFGKHICTARTPKCSTCPVLEFCRQVGVESYR